MGNTMCGLGGRPADAGPSGCQDSSSRKGRRLAASTCKGLLVNGGDRELLAAFALDPQCLTRRAFMSHETIIYDFAKAGDVEMLKVVAVFVRQHWQEVLSAGDVTLPENAQPCAESVLAAVASRPAARGRTPLMAACAAGHAQAVKQLLAMGADAWAAAHNCSRTALHTAVLGGHTQCVAALLEGLEEEDGERLASDGSSYVDVRSLTGYTALHYAAAMGRHEIVELLVNRHMASLLVHTKFEVHETGIMFEVGSTPMHMAAVLGDERTAAALCKAFAGRRMNDHTLRDPRFARDFNGHVPYQMALARKNARLAKMLHPSTNLLTLFKGEVRQMGVPRLAALAAAAVSEHLTGQIEALAPKAQQQQQQQQEEELASLAAASAVQHNSPSCVDGGSRCSSSGVNSSTESAASCSGSSDCEGESDHMCGVCLDAAGALSIVSCGHRLCATCALQLCKPPCATTQRQAQLQPAGCPFCRRPIRGWAAAPPAV